MINIKELPNPELIINLYKKYCHVKDITPDNFLSSHWKKFSRNIKINIDSEGNLIEFLGYGFGDLQYTHMLDKVFNYLCNLSYFIRLPDKKDIRFLIKHAIPILKKMDSYLSYDCFRQICSLVVIRKYFNLQEQENFNILIIGDGYGFLSALLKSVYKNSIITLVDIGKILLFQAVNLQRIYPIYSHHLFCGEEDCSDEIDFLYVPAENIMKIKNVKYKLIISISSMQEMNYETIYNYFTFFRLHSTEDNLLYCCNRELKLLPGGEIIEFLKYPWHAQDTHLFDEEPLFYRYFFSWRFPFIHYFEGHMRHRLTNLFLERH
ncbi:MAG: putative sugar O-methyltransferase [Candidatus Omnitrophica bacterium]|nr:putative sugar O-methyltransferase [Candidatus Omnitrophota bacterium]